MVARVNELPRLKRFLAGIVAAEKYVLDFFFVAHGDLKTEFVEQPDLDELELREGRYLYVDAHIRIEKAGGIAIHRHGFYFHVIDVDAHAQQSRGEGAHDEPRRGRCVPAHGNFCSSAEEGPDGGAELGSEFRRYLDIKSPYDPFRGEKGFLFPLAPDDVFRQPGSLFDVLVRPYPDSRCYLHA